MMLARLQKCVATCGSLPSLKPNGTEGRLAVSERYKKLFNQNVTLKVRNARLHDLHAG